VDTSGSRRVAADVAAGTSVQVRVGQGVVTPLVAADMVGMGSPLEVLVVTDTTDSRTEVVVRDGRASSGEDSAVPEGSALVLLAGAVRDAGGGRDSVDRGDSASAKHRAPGRAEVRNGEDGRAAVLNGLSLLPGAMTAVETSAASNRAADRLRKLDGLRLPDVPALPTSNGGLIG
jgi:hypothetical protein